MINIEPKHLKILIGILKQYDISFFLFGSRITPHVKQFSDIDLLYFENIETHLLLKLEEAFEDSDLPYKVDLLAYHKLDEDFKKIIGSRYICLQASSTLQRIEKTQLAHFQFLPKSLALETHEENGLYIIKSGLNSSMFNIVYGSPGFSPEIYQKKIDEIKYYFKNLPFAWWVPPSLRNPELTEYLIKAGLVSETIEHAMSCDLSDVNLANAKTALTVKPVFDKILLEDFIKLLEPYDHCARIFYEKLDQNHLCLSESLFVGYSENKPVTIATLFKGSLAYGIFNLLTSEKEQGKGYGTTMMQYLLQTAKNNGAPYVTLSASSRGGYKIYERLGFQKIGEFECFELSTQQKKITLPCRQKDVGGK